MTAMQIVLEKALTVDCDTTWHLLFEVVFFRRWTPQLYFCLTMDPSSELSAGKLLLNPEVSSRDVTHIYRKDRIIPILILIKDILFYHIIARCFNIYL